MAVSLFLTFTRNKTKQYHCLTFKKKYESFQNLLLRKINIYKNHKTLNSKTNFENISE